MGRSYQQTAVLAAPVAQASDLRHILHQCYTVTLPDSHENQGVKFASVATPRLPSGAMFLRPPFGEDVPPIPPPDPRLSPFEGPTPEWSGSQIFVL